MNAMTTVLSACLVMAAMTDGARDSTRESALRVQIRVGERSIPVTLDDTAVARDFATLFPLKLELSDYGGIEKIADLPRRLDISDEPAGYRPAAGDIAFYAPWGNLAIFLGGFRYSKGLVRLGRIDGGRDAVAETGTRVVTIEAASVPKTSEGGTP
jgi:hypothetical protein